MDFPDTFDEFAKGYGFIDKKEIYTNGAHLIPVFRVKQWLEHINNAPTVEDSYNKGYSDAVQGITDEMVRRNQHIEDNRHKGEWVKEYKGQVNSFCSKCDYEVGKITNFCPNCGADMRTESEDK